MDWRKYRIKIKSDAQDSLCALLMTHSLSGVEIEDDLPLTEEEMQLMFVDIPPQGTQVSDEAYISFYLEDTEEGEKVLQGILEEIEELRQYADLGECSLEVSQTRQEDWINNWKQFFHSFYVDDIFIKPSWEEESPDKKNRLQGITIEMDPGTAFGTGAHETTKLCMKAARRYVKTGNYVLDVGCGSGILGIVSVKSGAQKAVEIDLDPCAVEASKDNFDRNGIRHNQFHVFQGNILSENSVREEVVRCGHHGRYEVVFANILAEVLPEMTPCILPLMKPGGYYITSGILGEKVDIVKGCISETGFDVVDVQYEGEWACIVARRKAE